MTISHWSILTLIIVLLVGFWIGQTKPDLLGGYPKSLFSGG